MLGLFVGIALGLALAAAVAFYLTKGMNPYQSATPSRESPREVTKEAAKPGRADAAAPDKPRFDFYRILPGVEEPKIQKQVDRVAPDKSTAERAVSPDKTDAKAAAKPDARVVAKADERPAGAAPDAKSKTAGDRFWLQAGSFSSEADAEDLKARLAFAGWEAAIQPGTEPRDNQPSHHAGSGDEQPRPDQPPRVQRCGQRRQRCTHHQRARQQGLPPSPGTH